MNFFSAYLNRFAIARAVPTNVPDSANTSTTPPGIPNTVKNRAAKPGAWKASLGLKLQTTLHDRLERAPGFEKLFEDYVSSEPAEGRKYVKRLLGKCVALPEPDVLEEILRNEVVESLYLEGQVSARGWEALIAAMPAGFPVRSFTLSMTSLSSDEATLMYKALCGMPKLERLCFYMAGVTGPISFEWPYGPAFEALEAVTVSTSSVPHVDVCELLLGILDRSQVQSLSIQDFGAITTDQHARLADAIGRQALLNSVSLVVEQLRSKPKKLDCYTPFLCGQQPLKVVNLGGWEIESSKFNELLTELGHKPLTSLSLCNFKFLKGPGSQPVQIFHLAGMRSLLSLDLGWNSLEDDALVQLLLALKKEQTGLRFLSLNGNSIGSPVIAATAALLSANRTLQQLSLQLANGSVSADWDADALEALAEAFEANTSLLRLRASWSKIPKAYQLRLGEAVMRNVGSVAASGIWGALNSVHPGFPKDVAMNIYKQGLTQADGVRISSVNRAAWDASSGRGGPSK
ncbi:hypothetical protein [Variovorax sp. DT-64]|uniref:hypothetical protein n=1 Tax=Variovorax sp. DT-64 TaxID=3396160 RepID=UPI003F1B4874